MRDEEKSRDQLVLELAELRRRLSNLEQIQSRQKVVENEYKLAHAELNQIFHTAADAMRVIDKNFNMLRVNRTFLKLVGLPEHEVAGKKCYDVFPGERCHKDLCPLNMIMRGEERLEFEVMKKLLSGKQVPCILTVTPFRSPDGELIGIVENFKDITERKQAEDALAKQARELARSNHELEQFAYVASHDLQEPLRMVAGFAQLLSRRYQGKLDAEADEFIGFIVDGVTRMQGLIHDLLTYSRVGTRGTELVPVKMSECLNRALLNLKGMLEEKGALVTYDVLPEVMADGSQITQLFQNLVSNAVKFCTAPTPLIHCGVEEKAEEWVFFVRDNGIGIAAEFYQRVFVIFQRLHTRNEYPGTGIGLAICKKIVERHGGRIWIDSKIGCGSTVYFTIPVWRESK